MNRAHLPGDDYAADAFRLRVRMDRVQRDEDQARVNQARLRVRVSRDFISGASDVYPSEPVADEVES